jgi:Domain of unknown function (DUF4423)
VEQAAREFLRAVRGRRSQQAFSRRLGFKSNVCAKWEAGRRMPTALFALRACRKAGLDVQAALERFRSNSALHLESLSDAGLAAWLRVERGEQPIQALAVTSGLSRFRIARFLSGETRPRVPEFFALVSAMTRRLAELVALLVDIEQVPSLKSDYQRLEASRQAAYAHPWTAAVVALLDTQPFRERATNAEEIAATLGLDESTVQEILGVLVRAGVLVKRGAGYSVLAPLVTDTRADPEQAAALRRHWAGVSLGRLASPHRDDRFSYSVFTIAKSDFAALRKLQSDYYQRVRALIAESEPSELVGLVALHLMQWDPEQRQS